MSPVYRKRVFCAEVAVGQTKILRLVHSLSPALARRIMIKY